MRMLWIGLDNSPGSQSLRRNISVELRDGLEPSLSAAAVLPNYISSGYSNFQAAQLRFAPDQSKGVMGIKTSGTGVSLYISNSLSETVTPTTAAWSGTLNGAFCGNTIYGFFGSGSLLTAFDWATHSLFTVNKTGLGTVYSASLSDDETKLAITHSISPFVRVYNTSNWSYTDAVSAGSITSYCEWTKTSNHLLCVSETPGNAIYKYDPSLSTKTIISNSSNATINTAGSSNTITSFTTSTKGESIIVNTRRSGNNVFKFFEVNCGTDAITHIIPTSGAQVAVNAATFDMIGEKIYCFHGPINQRYVSSYDANTFVRDPEFNGVGLQFLATDIIPLGLTTLNTDYGTLSGTVRDVDNLPVERKVRVYRRATGELVGETMSDSVTGSYSIIIPTQDPGAYDVQFMIEDGELLNDLFYARATPQPV